MITAPLVGRGSGEVLLPRRRPLSSSRLVLLILFLVAAGCASSSTNGSTATQASRGNSRLITQEELATLGVSNLYEAIQRLRPLWLRETGRRSVNLPSEIAVVQNGSYVGSIEMLRTIPPEHVREIRYLDGPSAAATLPGMPAGRHVTGAIFIQLQAG